MPFSDIPDSQPRAIVEPTPPKFGVSNVTASAYDGDPYETTSDKDRKLHQEALTRFQTISQHEAPWRRKARTELTFVSGNKGAHWTPEQIQERRGRPCLEFDKISPSLDGVVNEARQSPPEPRISPVGNGADKDTAEIIQGLLRNIENDSAADVAYLTAYEHAVSVGRGWLRVNFAYENDEDFQQKILIETISNLFSVYSDPSASEFDYSDMRYCFVTEDMDRDLFKELYPNSNAVSMADFESIGDKIKDDWFPNNAVRVAEYWWIETLDSYIAQMPDGKVIPWIEAADQTEDGIFPVSVRKIQKKQVKGVKMCGTEILDRWDWPGKWIPIIPVLGKDILVDGKRELRGMIRPAMDANLAYDYARSKEVEAVALAPIAPWLAAEGSIEGYESLYADANRKGINVLPWKVRDEQGNEFPMPNRNTVSPDIQAIVMAVQQADADCKTTLSTWDPNLGAPAPDSSGRAILARQRQGDNAHFNYHDNLARAMRHTGRVILDLIPFIYSEERTINIYDPDGSMRQVPINKLHIEQGAARIYNLAEGAGRYDVVIGSGPSYATRRQQGVDAALSLFNSSPETMSRAADLLVRMIDMPLADQIADRLVPADIKAQQDQASPLPPAAMQIVQQQTQMISQLTDRIHSLSDVISKQTLKLESEERRNLITAQANIVAAAIKAQSENAQTLVEQDFAATKHRMDLLHSGESISQEAQRLELDSALNSAKIKQMESQTQQALQPQSTNTGQQ